MKTHRFLFLAFFLIFSPISLRSQEVVHTGDFIMEDFITVAAIPNVANITRITGNLILRGGLTPAFPLNMLQTIEGDLELNGLTALTTISGFLPALTNVGGDVIIQNNALLTRLDGLMALTDIGGSLQIGGVGDGEGNPVLAILIGTATSVEPEVPAFDALTTLGGSLTIANNGMLGDYPLFDNLPSIGGSLRIQNNALMSTFPSFNLLETITADFHIEDMPLPTALPDFPSLTGVGGNIVIINNAALSSCCSFLDILNNSSSTVNIMGNASGCSSRNEVGNSCYTGGNLNIDNVSAVPGNIRLITRIAGNLIISGGSHRSFPDFAALRIVTGSITVQDIHTVSGSAPSPPAGDAGLFAADNIFPELDSVGGNIIFERNYNLGSFRNVFSNLRHIGGVLRFGRSPGPGTVHPNRRFDALTGFDLLESMKGFALYEHNDHASRFTDIAKFTTFPSLTRVGSDGIIISNFALRELEDAAKGIILFPNLERVEGSVRFLESERVRSFPSFPKLRFIGGDLALSDFAELRAVSGFNALRFVGRQIGFTGRIESLRTIEGFNALESAGNISITVEGALRLVSGFNNLKRITGGSTSAGITLRVTEAGSVTEDIEIAGFERLESIEDGRFVIAGAFNRVPDFSNLSAVSTMTISGTRLTALPSFNNVRRVTRITMASNSSLTDCCAIKHIDGMMVIRSSNGAGCRSEENIYASCRRDLDVPTTIRLQCRLAGVLIFM